MDSVQLLSLLSYLKRATMDLEIPMTSQLLPVE